MHPRQRPSAGNGLWRARKPPSTRACALLIAAGIVLCGTRPPVARAAGPGWPILHHAIDARLDPSTSSLSVIDTVLMSPPRDRRAPLRVLLHRSLCLTRADLDGKPVSVAVRDGFDPRHFWAKPDYEQLAEYDLAHELEVAAPPDGWSKHPVLTLRYAGAILDSLKAPKVAYARGFETTRGLITERGVYLEAKSFWVPWSGEDPFTFTLTTRAPPGWETVSQGRRTGHGKDGEALTYSVWNEPAPMVEVYLVAGPYIVRQDPHGPVTLYTFTYADTPADLCQSYLKAAAEYLDLYQGRIGTYPFAKFALVENWWQSGYGMPSFTLLGDKVIRLPFIVHTSFGHEILHNWWGNGVFVDYQQGNWCEGLTTYQADYLYKEREGPAPAREYRLTQLQGYLDYAVGGGRDFPLREFRERESFSTQAIGYGKTMMVFHMLRRKLGDAAFDAGLRRLYTDFRFRAASWDDLVASFERASGQKLADWFEAWIGRPGAAQLSAELGSQGADECIVRLRQVEPFYDLQVPVRFTLAGGAAGTARVGAAAETTLVATLTGASVELRLARAATQVTVDPEYDVFRRLYREEIPPALSQTLGADSTLAIIGSRAPAPLAAALRALGKEWSANQNMKVVDEQEVTDAGRSGRALYLLGPGALADRALELGARLYGDALGRLRQQGRAAGASVVATVRDPQDARLAWTVVLPAGPDVVATLGRKLPHYGKYSYLVFNGEQNTDKGVWTVLASPLRLNVASRSAGAPPGGR
jgi:aminopeptidase N